MVDAIYLLSDSAYYSRWGMFTLGDGKEQSVGEVSYKIHWRNTLAALCRRGPDFDKVFCSETRKSCKYIYSRFCK